MERSTDPSSPCQRHSCSACCHDTRMTLTDADVARLEGLGRHGFYRESADGSRSLFNVAGRCVFLTEHGCAVYPDRPEGCVLYPLVVETPSNLVTLHDFCPFRREFSFSDQDRRRLLASVATEEADAAQRRGERGSVANWSPPGVK